MNKSLQGGTWLLIRTMSRLLREQKRLVDRSWIG